MNNKIYLESMGFELSYKFRGNSFKNIIYNYHNNRHNLSNNNVEKSCIFVTPPVDNTSANNDIFVSILSSLTNRREAKYIVVTTPLLSSCCGWIIDRPVGRVHSFVRVQSIWYSLPQGIRPMFKEASGALYRCIYIYVWLIKI